MQELIVILVIIGLITGAICAAIASAKERSVAGWFFGGLAMGCCLHIFGALVMIIIVAVIPDLKAERMRDQAIERDNRRLREQLLQEQMKAEAFRQHAAARLDAHDVHLGLDTRAVTPALPASNAPLALGLEPQPTGELSAPPPVPLPESVPAVTPPSRQWFYEVNGDSRGPVSEEQLVAMLQDGQLNRESLLWTEQLGEWRAAGEIAHLRRWLGTI